MEHSYTSSTPDRLWIDLLIFTVLNSTAWLLLLGIVRFRIPTITKQPLYVGVALAIIALPCLSIFVYALYVKYTFIPPPIPS